MGNIIDDIRANEDTFADRPFNEVDSLALAQLSYARMPVNGRDSMRRRRTSTSPWWASGTCYARNAMTTCSARCGRRR